MFALGMISFFISGGLTGIFLANPPMIFSSTIPILWWPILPVMGSAAFFGFLTGIYHWFPKTFGSMMDPCLGTCISVTFAGVYLIFFPLHFLGMIGLHRRYYLFKIFESFDAYADMNKFISLVSFLAFAVQLIFLYNFFKSIFFGKPATANPWEANTLEWTTPVNPESGNWPGPLPVVYRWPYDYSLPGEAKDFNMQTDPQKEKSMHKSKPVKLNYHHSWNVFLPIAIHLWFGSFASMALEAIRPNGVYK